MTTYVNESMNHHVHLDRFSTSSKDVQSTRKMARDLRGLVSPAVLAIYGVMANALFWYGLLAPYNPLTRPEGGYLHALFTLVGIAMALGGALAIITIHRRHGMRVLRKLDYMGGVLSTIVLTATIVLVVSAFLSRV